MYTLIIGNKNYSSWSLRGWLLLRAFDIPFTEERIPLYVPGYKPKLLEKSPAGLVPVLIDGDVSVWDSLAIGEYLAEQYPDKGYWPTSKEARALARCVVSEIHSGFFSVRSHMPMNCRASHPGFGRNEKVDQEIERILAIWQDCRSRFGEGGPFLFGKFSIADAFYAPVVCRFQTYAVPLDEVSASYSKALLDSPPMVEWFQASQEEPESLSIIEDMYQD